MNAGVRAAGERFELLDAEKPIIVDEREDLQIVVGYDNARRPLLLSSFCNSFCLHGINDVLDSAGRQSR